VFRIARRQEAIPFVARCFDRAIARHKARIAIFVPKLAYVTYPAIDDPGRGDTFLEKVS